MSGISSKAANITPNKEKTFQGQQFDDDLGVNYVQFRYRNHDPQIGRFIEIDPLSDQYVHNSTYAFSENKVTGHFELEGLEAVVATYGDKNEQQIDRGLQQRGVLDGKAYNQGFEKGFAKGAALTAGVIGAFLYPATASLIMVSELSGVPMNGSPQMMAETAVASTVESEVVPALTQLQKNQAAGAAFEQVVVKDLAKQGHTSITEQLTIKAGNGVKTRVDLVSKDANGVVALTEAKASVTAPLTTAQKAAHPSLAQAGGVVVGKGKPDFPGGTVIPPTKVNVVRP